MRDLDRTAPGTALCWTLMALALVAPGADAPGEPDGGFSPEQARARMVLPEGFRAEVFASEPDVRQPVAACFDERGRLWVIEYLQYPNPAGLKPVTVDQYLRTEYDRIPEPPPRGPRGADRIKILEDTDGDGRADKVTTFVEGLNLASAIAVGHGGIFVGQAPYLLFYPDANRDDRPDGDPDVLLTGFGLQDAHATVNSLIWGPDGWLYGAQGSTVTARIRGIEFQQGIWRYHPRTDRFELFAEGGGNTWGLDFDRSGHAFGSSNGGFVAFHMVQGGNYWKGFAKHGPLHNPRTYGYFESLPYDGPRPGGHVTPGGIIYKGDSFPDQFHGAFIGGNLLSNAVYWHTLTRDGSSFRARSGGTLIDARDRWFRPIDLLTGPDGSVVVVDWYDRRASHLDPRDNWDKSNGRIYRIVHEGTTPVVPGDLARLTSDALVDLRTRGNDWWPDMGRRLLADRRDPAVIPRLRALLAADTDETTALRDLWALDASGGFDTETALTCLAHPIAGVRRWAVRLLGDDPERPVCPTTLDKLTSLACGDPDPAVRSQLASSCARWPTPVALPILVGLIGRDEHAKDPHIPLLLWWAIERHLRTADPLMLVDRLATRDLQQKPVVRDHVIGRLARALVSRGEPTELEAAAILLRNAPDEPQAQSIVAGMDRGLEGRTVEGGSGVLVELLADRLARPDPSAATVRLAVRLGDPSAFREAARRALDQAARAEDREAMIEILGQVVSDEGRAALLSLLGDSDHPDIRLAAMAALGHYPGTEVATALLDLYPSLDDSGRSRARGLLTSRGAWADRLLEAIEAGRVAARDLRPSEVLKIAQLGDDVRARRVERVWGRLPGPNSEAKRQRIAEVRGMLPEGDKGSAARGRAVFREHCATCHRLFDEGETVGPDLTGAERGDLEFLLQSVVDPSALIRKEYEARTVALADGQVVTGLVLEETEAAITLVDSDRQKVVIPRDQIEEMRPASASHMPEGLLDRLTEPQIRDLFRYLQSPGPVAPG